MHIEDAVRIRLPEMPIDGHEITFYQAVTDSFSGGYVREVTLRYHVNTPWSKVGNGNGADFVDQWEVLEAGHLKGRLDRWGGAIRYGDMHTRVHPDRAGAVAQLRTYVIDRIKRTRDILEILEAKLKELGA